ncbi:CaiB/BaiF CoA transferase family protein [Microbacterium sp. No. 7]|uniref:CaiB/BaiF CoA transferase family protein n=1 Tax=Microbacterium sp. No. 7 TaxID=1714373 RepID=UPI0006ED33B2|nr:CoA transferase [Microbacterium sp. No. 7]ALJ21620.1 CoA-transferase [Microbacterium sp. No. 7]
MTERQRPLEGFRILEVGGYISMPFGTSLLNALGAEVVKVEKPVTGEDFRRHQNDEGVYFRQYNTGKKSISVDLKQPEGVEVVRAIVPGFDVFVENLRPGKVAALGLGPDDLRALRPDIVYGSVTGFGSSGPLAHRPAYDTIGQSFGGFYSLLSDAGHPQLSGTIFADLVTGFSTATGILAALLGRVRTGEGTRLETSIMESVSVLTADAVSQWFELGGVSPTRESRHPQAQNFVVQTSDDHGIALHLSSSQKFWQSLCRALDRPDLLADPRFAEYRAREANYFDLVPEVERAFATKPVAHWERVLSEHDVPFAPVLSIGDYLANEQVNHLGILEPQADGHPLLRPPWTFDGVRPDRRGRAPKVGADTRAVVSEALPAERIDDLLARGVLYADES